MPIVAKLRSRLRRLVAVRVKVLVYSDGSDATRKVVSQELLHEVGPHVPLAFDRDSPARRRRCGAAVVSTRACSERKKKHALVRGPRHAGRGESSASCRSGVELQRGLPATSGGPPPSSHAPNAWSRGV